MAVTEFCQTHWLCKSVGSEAAAAFIYIVIQVTSSWTSTMVSHNSFLEMKFFHLLLIQEEQLSFSGERMYTRYWYTASWVYYLSFFFALKQ